MPTLAVGMGRILLGSHRTHGKRGHGTQPSVTEATAYGAMPWITSPRRKVTAGLRGPDTSDQLTVLTS